MNKLIIAALVIILSTAPAYAQSLDKKEVIQHNFKKIIPTAKESTKEKKQAIKAKTTVIKPSLHVTQKTAKATDMTAIESAGIQEISSAISVGISRGWDWETDIPSTDYKKVCEKLNIFAKKPDGEIYKFTAAFHSRRGAFGMRGRVWCETETIMFPVGEDIYFIATVIDDTYQVSPAKQTISLKINEESRIYLKISRKTK